MTDALAGRVQELLRSASFEVTPKDAAAAGAAGLPAGTRIYITLLPAADPAALVPAAATLRAAGLEPVPHLAARSITDLDALDGLLGRLSAEAGVTDVLTIAGSRKEPAGTLTTSLELLRSGLLERHGITRAGVAGHPEGSPDIGADAQREALREKNAFADASPLELRVVTQFALDGEPYLAWERRTREDGNRLPVVVGLPGVTSPPTLLRYGLACGIGASLEIFRKRSGGLLRLATTRLWKPDAIVEAIAQATLDDPQTMIRGLHFFPVGGLERTTEWVLEATAGARKEQDGDRSPISV